MPVDTSIYQNYLKPPKSIAEYGAEMDIADQNRMALESGRMNLIAAKQAQADEQAVRAAYQKPGFDPQSDSGIMELMRLNPKAGFAAAEARQKALKAQADLGHVGAQTEKEKAQTQKTTIEAAGSRLKQYRDTLDFIDTPQGAARWLQAQFQDPLTSEMMGGMGSIEQALSRIPQDPAGFQQWRQQAALGMEKHMAEMRQQGVAAEQARHNKSTEGIQIRGQNLVNDRAKDANERAREANDINRSLTNEKKQLEVDALKRQKEGSISSAANQIAVIDKALSHPGRETSTGLSGTLDPRNYTPGTDAADFKAVLDQIGGAAFLQAFESLKGGGQITEIEGKRATDAIARLNRAQSDDEFKKSLTDLREVMTTGYKRLSGSDYGGGPGGLTPAEQAELDALRKRFPGKKP